MSETTAFLLLKGWLTLSVLAFAINELRLLRRDERAARAKAGAEIVSLRPEAGPAEPVPERRAA